MDMANPSGNGSFAFVPFFVNNTNGSVVLDESTIKTKRRRKGRCPMRKISDAAAVAYQLIKDRLPKYLMR